MFFVVLTIHVLAAHAWLYQCGERRWAVSAAFGTAWMAVLPAQFARVTGSMFVASSISAALALVLLALAWRRGPPFPVPRLPSPSIGSVWLLLAFVALGLVSWTAIQGHYFDEDWVHYALTSALARGVAPVEHPLYPGETFPYHYGFNALSAQLVASGWRVEFAHDVVRIWSFVLFLMSSAAVGRKLAGTRGAALAIVLVPLASSPLQYLLWGGMGQFELHWSMIPGGWAHNSVPIVMVSFFQPPMGFGMAIGLATLVLLTERLGVGRTRRMIVGAVMLALLSAGQILFFGLIGLGVGAAVVVEALRYRQPRRLLDLVPLSAAFGVAVLLGGFFDVATPGQMLVAGRYFNHPFTTSVLRHLVVFGLPLLALLYWIVRVVRRTANLEVALLVIVVICLAVPNFVIYPKSWDIVKFYMIAAVVLNAMFVGMLAAIRPRAVAHLLLAVSLVSSVMWLGRTTVLDGKYGIHAWREGVPAPVARAVRDELPLGPYDRVLTGNDQLSKVGILTPGFDPAKHGGTAYPIDQERNRRWLVIRQRALRDLARDDLEALGVSWLVMTPIEKRRLSAIGQQALEDTSRFESYGEVSVGRDKRLMYRVLGP